MHYTQYLIITLTNFITPMSNEGLAALVFMELRVRVGLKMVGCLVSNPCCVCTDAKVENKHVPDPVNEICTDFPVKIADLGNACWTVSRKHYYMHN